MPGFLTDYANNKVLDLIFGATAFTPPVTLYLGLSTAAANKAGTKTEPSTIGTGYARVAVTNNATNFPAASGGTKGNGTVITWPAPTADWGTILSLFVSDALTGGNVLAMADLTTPRFVANGGSAPKLVAGSLFLSFS